MTSYSFFYDYASIILAQNYLSQTQTRSPLKVVYSEWHVERTIRKDVQLLISAVLYAKSPSSTYITPRNYYLFRNFEQSCRLLRKRTRCYIFQMFAGINFLVEAASASQRDRRFVLFSHTLLKYAPVYFAHATIL